MSFRLAIVVSSNPFNFNNAHYYKRIFGVKNAYEDYTYSNKVLGTFIGHEYNTMKTIDNILICFVLPIVGSVSWSFLQGCAVGSSSIVVLIALISIVKKYVWLKISNIVQFTYTLAHIDWLYVRSISISAPWQPLQSKFCAISITHSVVACSMAYILSPFIQVWNCVRKLSLHCQDIIASWRKKCLTKVNPTDNTGK